VNDVTEGRIACTIRQEEKKDMLYSRKKIVGKVGGVRRGERGERFGGGGWKKPYL
jgi:hypothetical protein